MQKPIKAGRLITVQLVIAVSAFFMANAEMPPFANVISGLFIALFILPSLIAAIRWLGVRGAVLLFTVLGVFAVAVETIGISTGYPYGDFSYSELLGYRLFGLVPWSVAFAWTPLILAAYGAAAKIFSRRAPRIAAIALLLVGFDLVIDPGAVRLGFWAFSGPGWYYGVPLTNYLGWIISGLAGGVLLEFVIGKMRPLLPVPVQIIESGFLSLSLWTYLSIFSVMPVPAMVGAVLLFILGMIYFRHHYRFDEMVVLVDNDNTAIGTASKLQVHNAETPLHRAFSVFIFNRNGEVLLQQRAFGKKTWGGIWSNSCCGHLMLHESVISAARRRVRYELGIDPVDLEIVLPDYRYRAERDGVVENEICPVLAGFTDRQPRPNPAEVAGCVWKSWEQFLEEAGDPASDLSPWAKEEAKLLDLDPVFDNHFKSKFRS